MIKDRVAIPSSKDGIEGRLVVVQTIDDHALDVLVGVEPARPRTRGLEHFAVIGFHEIDILALAAPRQVRTRSARCIQFEGE